MFDINLIPLFYLEGKEQPSLPGLYAAGTPHHSARGRTGDLVFMLVSLKNITSISPTDFQSLLDRLVQTYFQIPGTVTTALRSVAEVLSQSLLDRNLNNSSANRQGLALLNLAAIHGNQLYLGHSGPTHSYLVSPLGVQHFTDPQLAGRGLGLSRTISIHYHQANIEAGNSLIFCPEPPPAWSSSFLSGGTSLNLDALQRRLVGQAPPNLTAAVIRLQEGNGKILLKGTPFVKPTLPDLKPVANLLPSDLPPSPTSSQETPAPIPQPSQLKTSETPETVKRATPPVKQTSAETAQPVKQIETTKPTQKTTISPTTTSEENSFRSESSSTEVPPTPRKPARHQPAEPTKSPQKETGHPENIKVQPGISLWQQIAPFWRWATNIYQHIGKFFQAVIQRLLPTSSDSESRVSPGLLVFIAIAVPLVISAIGLVVYVQKGQTEQYLYYFNQAQSIAQEATSQSDPQIVRTDWESTLILLQKAEGYKVTTDSTALHQQAQNALDQLDDVVRMTFQPALLTTLPSTTNISRMVTNGDDLYMLDSTNGSVLRAFLTGRGYQIDTTFDCGPGSAPLVDITSMPLNNLFNATIVGIDSTGNLLYCLPGNPPIANKTALTPPADQWGHIASFMVDSNQLYVLDPQNNIGMYSILQDNSFNDQPEKFFTSPQPISDTIDFVVNAQDLYLLHSDGHLTLCTFSLIGVEPTRCTDPAPFSDPRPGYNPKPTSFQNVHFSQIQFTSPPDPSIYLLDPVSATLYHFSLRLNLQRLLSSQALTGFTLPVSPATAFYVSENRIVFLAFNNQVFLSNLP